MHTPNPTNPEQNPNSQAQSGRGSRHNPPNRFERHSHEQTEDFFDPETRKAETKVFMESAKSIVNQIDSPDLNLAFSVNPYQGCEHGCAYCYARPSHEYWGFGAGLDFEQKIVVKYNAPTLLAKKLSSSSWFPAPISLSGNTDCYQPLEQKHKLTRELLKTFYTFGNPVSIITKNSLVTRDLDILQDLAKERLVHVYFSVTSLNEDTRRKMEPRTATAVNKLKAMEKLSQAGIPVGLMCAPVVPGLNDHEIPAILEAASAHGALWAGYTVVRLNGAVGGIFRHWLRRAFPDRADKILSQIAECHGGSTNDSDWGRRLKGEGKWAEMIQGLFRKSREKHFAGKQMPDYDLSRFRPTGSGLLF